MAVGAVGTYWPSWSPPRASTTGSLLEPHLYPSSAELDLRSEMVLRQGGRRDGHGAVRRRTDMGSATGSSLAIGVKVTRCR